MIVIAEYLWINHHDEICSKSKIININIDTKDKEPVNEAELIRALLNITFYPNWSYEKDSEEIVLHPTTICIDPFKKAPHVLILCDTWTNAGKPTEFNLRYKTNLLFRENIDLKSLITIKQDFYIIDPDVPLNDSEINKDTCYLTGYNNCVGRNIVDKIIHFIIDSRIPCYSFNANSLKGSWNISIGPCEGIICADYIIILRYILNRVGEMFKTCIKYEPVPVKTLKKMLNCSTNFCIEFDKDVAKDDQEKKLKSYIENLKNTHNEDIKVFSTPNKSNSELTYSQNAVKLLSDPFIKDILYLSDSRPPANVNPYAVLEYILNAVV
uniref:glutamine synthetase n=1 Tax=viral metagenome TaxID=1070528 RepID=A0A6C0EKA9_9ZZZZ